MGATPSEFESRSRHSHAAALKPGAGGRRRVEWGTARAVTRAGGHLMDTDVVKFAEMVAIFVGMCGVLGLGALLYGVASRLLGRATSQLPAPQADDQRLVRLEQAVDTIAVDVERISESQRFISK